MVRLKKEVASELYSPQSLENSVVRIEQLLAAGRRVASEMGRLKIGTLLIGNRPSLHCAMEDLARWGKACEDAFTEKLIADGHFKAPSRGSARVPARTAAPRKKAKKARR